LNPQAVDETRSIIEGEGGICAVHIANMMVAAEVAGMVQACVDRFGRLDVLVNNVGGSAPGDPISMAEELWDHQIDYNLKTVFLGCKYALPVMVAQGKGAIVNISSIAGLRNDGIVGRVQVAYSASKAGVIQFSRATAGAYARQGVRVNTVVPGLIHTPLVEVRLAKTVANNDLAGLIATRNAKIPLGRMGDAWDVAHAVLFLASEEARHITGTEIIVDGGLAVTMP
jgi:NAD(P)-dependent dehydrogenase (short-subunit alcohol dehydrogenase family)